MAGTRPLGIIPPAELKRARLDIHKIIDPIWQKKQMRRGQLYSKIARRLGVDEYHTAEIQWTASTTGGVGRGG